MVSRSRVIQCIAVSIAFVGPTFADLANGDFETGDFSGWTVGITPTYAEGGRPYNIDPSGDGWVVASSNQGALNLSPIDGYSAFNGFDGGVVGSSGALYEADLTFFLRQGFSWTDSLDSATLAFTFDIRGGPRTSYASRGTPVEARVFSVNILDTSLQTLATVYQYAVAPQDYEPNPPVTSPVLDIAPALSSLGAGSYVLEFSELIPQYYTGAGAFVLDNISLDVQTSVVPVPGACLLGILGLSAAGWRLKRRTT